MDNNIRSGKLLSDLPSLDAETRKHMERDYRRGYLDGWVMAIDAMYALMFEDRLSREDAHNKAWDFWQNELSEWRTRGNREPRFEMPPEL